MPWTTPETAVAGQVLTAAYLNTNLVANTNFLYQVPSVQVRRTSDLTSYASNTAITWQSEAWDTDTMWSSGTDVTIKTAGIYLMSFKGRANGAATITRIVPRIYKGAGEVVETECTVLSGVASTFAVNAFTKCNVNDVITASVIFSGGSSYVIDGNSSELSDQTSLTVTWIGSA